MGRENRRDQDGKVPVDSWKVVKGTEALSEKKVGGQGSYIRKVRIREEIRNLFD